MASRAKAADDDLEIAKSRVVTLQTTARGGAPSKNLAQRWLKLVEAAQNGTVQQTEDAYQKFLLTLGDMELLSRKLAATKAAQQSDYEAYQRKEQELNASLEQAKQLIETKKQELTAARVWRQQQEEYEVLRKQVIEVQPRLETQQQIDALQREIDTIRDDIRKQEHTYQVIAKKCAAVRHQLDDLLNSFPGSGGGGAGGVPDPMQLDG